MPQIKNSEVVENVLKTLVNISSRKTTKGFAITTMSTLIKELEGQYLFLRNIAIKDTRFLEDETTITIIPEIDTVSPEDIGKALWTIITTMNRSLGKNAGHFFIKEIQSNLDEECSSTIKDMGIDLSLMQLEHEVSEWEETL